MNRRTIAIVTDDPGWHGARLTAALDARGLASVYASLRQCRIDLDQAPHGIVVPGFKDALPDGVIVRGVPGGTLEQVVLRLDVLHALRDAGVPVYNDGRAIERTVDKAMTSLALRRAGVPTPPTWVAESFEHACAVARRECGMHHGVVLKPLFGSQGKNLRLVRSVAEMPDAMAQNGVYYLQRFIDSGAGDWHDWRLFVIAGRVRAAMIRRGASWISNGAQGARCEAAQPPQLLARLAEDAVRALDIDYAGVDVIVDRAGEPFVIEVNGIPAWKGLQGVTDVNLAQAIVDDFVARRLPRRLEAVG
jgi:RimK family alpha-L-glutamate ligase